MIKVLLFMVWALALCFPVAAQDKDTLIVKDTSGNITIGSKPDTTNKIKVDTAAKKKFSPRQAALRSAIFPGLGQVYNKKYWKLPIVYAAIGIPVALFIDNKSWYNRTRYALAVVNSPSPTPDSLNAVHSQLRPLVDSKATNSILRYRNEFRRNMDYSILFTLLFWGLNIVDATVDAHLKGFDVSDDLKVSIRPALLPGNAVGFTLAFTLGDSKSKTKTISSPSHF
jgi:hypothetical protein